MPGVSNVNKDLPHHNSVIMGCGCIVEFRSTVPIRDQDLVGLLTRRCTWCVTAEKFEKHPNELEQVYPITYRMKPAIARRWALTVDDYKELRDMERMVTDGGETREPGSGDAPDGDGPSPAG